MLNYASVTHKSFMIWKSSVLIIHGNGKMYEKLDMEKAERFRKQQNTHRGGKVSIEYGVIFSVSSPVSKTSIWISSWDRMGFFSVSPWSAGLLCVVTVPPPSTFSASITA